MRHLCTGVIVGILACLVLTSSASAITIFDVRETDLTDPTHWWNPIVGGKLAFGSEGYTLMWTRIGSDFKELLNSSALPGGPTGDYIAGKWMPANPAWLSFKTASNQGTGSGPYQPSGTLPGIVIPRLYTLESWDANRRFDFSVLFYDPNMAETDEWVASVILTGNFGTEADPGFTADPFNVKRLTARQVHEGFMVTFDVGAAMGEEVAVTIETKGTYAAGFFLDNIDVYSPTSLATSTSASVMPEPATMALLAFGLGGIAMRRRRAK